MLSPKSAAILEAACLQGSLPASADELFANEDRAPDQQDLKVAQAAELLHISSKQLSQDMVKTLLAELADSQTTALQLRKQVNPS